MMLLTRPLPEGRPANDGAHRLGWWMGQDEARVEALATHPEVGPEMIDRLLSGEVEPEWSMALAIDIVTLGDVRVGDWQRPRAAGADWGTRPVWRERIMVAA